MPSIQNLCHLRVSALKGLEETIVIMQCHNAVKMQLLYKQANTRYPPNGFDIHRCILLLLASGLQIYCSLILEKWVMVGKHYHFIKVATNVVAKVHDQEPEPWGFNPQRSHDKIQRAAGPLTPEVPSS